MYLHVGGVGMYLYIGGQVHLILEVHVHGAGAGVHSRRIYHFRRRLFRQRLAHSHRPHLSTRKHTAKLQAILDFTSQRKTQQLRWAAQGVMVAVKQDRLIDKWMDGRSVHHQSVQ